MSTNFEEVFMMVEICPFYSFENNFDGTTFHNQMSRMLIARLKNSTMLFSEMYCEM